LRTELIDTLLRAGVVTEAQVERATNYAFSTGLVERLLCLGYGSEDDVFKIIRNNLKLAVIEGNELDNIPKEALESVPHDMITRNHFLPFYADETKIHIAFFDPTKDSCFHEIHFFTSKRIVPFGVKASVLAKALNRYFDLNVPEEFKFGKEQISDTKIAPPPLVEKESATAKPTLPPIPTMPNVKEPPKPPLPTIEKKEAEDTTELQKLLEQQRQELINLKNKVSELEKNKEASTPTPAQKEQKEQEPQETIDTASFNEEEDSFNDFRDIGNMQEEVIQEVKSPSQPAPVEPITKTEEQSVYVDTTSIELATDKDQIINAVNNELKKISKRTMLLFVKYDELITVDGTDIKIPLQAPSFFKDVHDSAKRFYGIPPKSYVADEFFNKFGGYLPKIICVVPVSIENEVFAILYAEEAENPMQVEEVAEKMAEAFDRLLS